jgi:hypothetical protein
MRRNSLHAAFGFLGRPPSRPLARDAAALARAIRIVVEPSCSSNSRGTEMSASSDGTCSPYPPSRTRIVRKSSCPAFRKPGSVAIGNPTTAPLFRAIITQPSRRSYRALTASNDRLMRRAPRAVAASNSSFVGTRNSAMIVTPSFAHASEIVRHDRANFHDLRSPKSRLIHQCHRAIRTIQRQPRQCAIRPKRVDAGRRMIVRIDDDPDATNTRDRWHEPI